MKVRELIEQLSKMNPDSDVVLAGKDVVEDNYRYGQVDTANEIDGVCKLYADLDDYWDVEEDEEPRIGDDP